MNAENKLKLFLLMRHVKEATSEMWSSEGNKQWNAICTLKWSFSSVAFTSGKVE